MLVQNIIVGGLGTNCYLITCEKNKHTYIIDPGAEPDKIIRQVKIDNLIVTGIINTHGHADHISGNGELKKRYPAAKLYIHKNDSPMLADTTAVFNSPESDVPLSDNDILNLGDESIKVIHTPGHTPGSICLYVENKFLFSGDTLFCGDIGRCDLPGGNEQKIMISLEKLSRLISPETKLFPGHGPQCVMKKEISHNPYLK